MNSRRIFVTGGGGFVGRSLLRVLERSPDLSITALDRSGALAASGVSDRIIVVRGDLLDPSSYAEAIRECDCAVHLAAATGKASSAAHQLDTAVGTETLVAACRNAGVPRFLLVSSIAAKFPDKRHYPYAVAKQRAEAAVVSSGLDYAILRPTMILGDGAPILASLSALALAPVVVMPGSGRVRVQPIAVDDVVRAILAMVQKDWFRGGTYEIGGPEILPIEELLQRIRVRVTGKRGPVLHVPVGLIQVMLRAGEGAGLRNVLPATAGQFSSFRQDGDASPNEMQQEIASTLVPVDRMIGDAAPSTTPGTSIDRECVTFARHLLASAPDRALIGKYAAAVETLPILAPRDNWDRALLRFARGAVWRTRCADAYAALFDRSSAIRKRLVLLLALMESRVPYADEIDRPVTGSPAFVILRVTGRGLWSILWLLLGMLLLTPLRLATAVRGKAPA